MSDYLSLKWERNQTDQALFQWEDICLTSINGVKGGIEVDDIGQEVVEGISGSELE